MAFFSSKPFDYVCFGNGGKIECSDTLENCLFLAKLNNWAVARIYPERYAVPGSPLSAIETRRLNKQLERRRQRNAKRCAAHLPAEYEVVSTTRHMT